MVTANQDEALLYCVAENSLFRNGSIIDLWQLEVHCKSIWLFFVYSACSSIHSMNLIGSSALYALLFVGTIHHAVHHAGRRYCSPFVITFDVLFASEPDQSRILTRDLCYQADGVTDRGTDRTVSNGLSSMLHHPGSGSSATVDHVAASRDW